MVNIYVLEVHIWSEELPRVHWSIEREAERFSIKYKLAEDWQFHICALGFVERAQVEEHLKSHAFGFAFR